jgi:putative transposase
LDFVYGQIVTGREFRVLNILDDVTQECLRALVDTLISGQRKVRELTDLIAERAQPKMIVSDNRAKLRSAPVLVWPGDVGAERALHRAGKADTKRVRRKLQRSYAR